MFLAELWSGCGVAGVKTPNEMALKANERKNKEGICQRIFVEHFISPAETEVGRERDGGFIFTTLNIKVAQV